MLREHCRTEHQTLAAFGIEVELEGCTDSEALRQACERGYVMLTGDGSLRDRGLEFITMPSVNQKRTIRDLVEVLELSGGRPTYRCGTHVHVCVAPLTVPQFASVMALATFVEPYLFAYCGEDRHDSIFAVPLFKCRDIADAVTEARDMGQSFNEYEAWRRITGAGNKYHATNFYSAMRRCTIEFRHAPGFTRVKELDEWVTICRNIVRLGAEYTSPFAVWSDIMERGSRSLVARVFEGIDIDSLLVEEHFVDAAEDMLAVMAQGWRDDEERVTDWSLPDVEEQPELPAVPRRRRRITPPRPTRLTTLEGEELEQWLDEVYESEYEAEYEGEPE